MTDNKKEKPEGILKKSEARMAAVKALYSADIHSAADEMPDPWALALDIMSSYDDGHEDHKFASMPDKKFLTKLVTGVCENLEAIDFVIKRNLSEKWTKERMGTVMVALLRVAVFELSSLQKIPFKVIINEYVDIAKSFFSDKDSAFVNGILDKIAHEVRGQ